MKLVSEAGQKPLWSQIYDIILERISTGKYKIGEKLPTELEIMDEFEVSRMPVRQAMNKLITDGIIERMRGKGTVVLEKDDKVGTCLRSSFNGILEKNNHKNRKVIFVGFCKPPKNVAEFFKMDEEIKILKIIREIIINNTIVSVHETYLSNDVPLSDKDDYNGSLYDKLKTLNYNITNVKEKISCSLMSSEEKKLFGINRDEAVMHRQRKGYSNNKPIEFTKSSYISTGYELEIDLM